MQSTPTSTPASPLDAVVSDLCGKEVVLLGETGEHGDGEAHALKGELAVRLIDECGFSQVMFESGIYDFLALADRVAAGTAEEEQLEQAIGRLWAHEEATTSWIAALFERARTGAVRLAGLDGQVHSTAMFARTELPAMVTDHLAEERGRSCKELLDRHLNWRYNDEHPYSDSVYAELVACLDDALAAWETSAAPAADEAQLVMTRNLRTVLSAPFTTGGTAGFNTRDALMYENFRWLRGQPEGARKTIIWCATVHAVKSFESVDELVDRAPLGAWIHRELGDRAAAIGFSAFAGRWSRPGGPVTEIPEAPAGTLERAARPDAPYTYLDREALASLGPISSRALSHARPVRARWDALVDGIIVIRNERPPR